MNKIDIYTSATCPYCIKAKKLLTNLNLTYVEHNIDDNFEEITKELSEKFQRQIMTVPQIIINNHYVGGYDDLEAMYKSGKLKEIID